MDPAKRKTAPGSNTTGSGVPGKRYKADANAAPSSFEQQLASLAPGDNFSTQTTSTTDTASDEELLAVEQYVSASQEDKWPRPMPKDLDPKVSVRSKPALRIRKMFKCFGRTGMSVSKIFFSQ